MNQSRNIVIIGSGMAGYTLLRELRKLDKGSEVTLICADNGNFYSKPMLSNALDKQKTPESLVVQTAQKMVDANNFELINKTFIDRIDPASKTVHSGSTSWNYQTLVLATGSKPIRLPIDGDAASDIFSVNHLDHYRHLHPRLLQARHVAIIGPGLIGCEFANDLASVGIPVNIIGPDAWPISTLLPREVGEFLQRKLAAIGCDFHLNNTVNVVNKESDRYRLQLAQGQTLEADLVLSAVGLRANTELARDSELETGRGFVTDRYLRTSEVDIYALGDCAEVDGYHLPFILPIMQCARALAQTLTGQLTAVNYPPMPVAIKTPACPVVVAPSPAKTRDWRVEKTTNGVKALCYAGEQLTGFALAGDCVGEKQALQRLLPDLL